MPTSGILQLKPDLLLSAQPVPALPPFKDKGVRPLGFFKTVNGGDVGVIERGEQFGFTLEMRSASLASSSGRILIVTSQPSLLSFARKTSVIPPMPSGALIS